MNPYLEQDDVWHDFHERIIPAIAERLVAQVRPKYIVKIDEHIYVHEIEPDAASGRFLGRADPSVASAERVSLSTCGRAASPLAEAPVEVRLPADDVERLSFVEIRDRRNRELITVIEVLSPANKRAGADRELYLNKRRELLGGPVHLVEIDLLRAARPLPLLDRPDCVYSILVSRSEERPYARFWPIALRDQLPTSRSHSQRPTAMLRLISKPCSTRCTTPRVTRITSTLALPSPPSRPRIKCGLIN